MVTSIAAITMAGTNGQPDLTKAYGVLYKDGATVAWPETLTTISLSNLPFISSMKATKVISYGADKSPSATFTYGQLYSGETAVPWPPSLTGYEVIATSGSTTTTSSSSTSSTQTTASSTTSATSETGTTSTSITGTGTSTSISISTGASKLPTSTSSLSPAVSSASSGISTGATAGIAIGCALAGLLIGLVAAFCLFRRKGKRNSAVDNVVLRDEVEVAYPSDKGTPPPPPPPVNDMQLSQFLLEATPDRDIAQETQSIGALIEQHVESYYHMQPMTVDAGVLASALAQLGFPLATTTNSASSLDTDGVVALCLDPGSRQVGLRHVINRVLFSSIDMHSPHGPSMLPAPVASFLRGIPPTESDRFGDSQANALALRKWRNLSAFLLHPARSQRTSLPTGDAAVAVQAQELGNSLNSFLRFFVDPHHQQQQADHLHAVIEECAKLGYVLFSHPSDWEFVYEEGVGGAANLGGGVVVEVGLCKLGGGGLDGSLSSPGPQRLVEPVAVPFPSAK